MDRKEFLSLKSTAAIPVHTKSVKRRTSSGLTKYAGSWGADQTKHLLSRTLFGYTKAELDSFSGKSLETAVADILNINNTAPDPPLNNYGTGANTDPNVPLGQTWINAQPSGTLDGLRRQSYLSWWTGQIIYRDSTIREKMVLFWHNHLATDTDTVGDPLMCYNHNKLLRKYALGNFRSLIHDVTIDAAMLVYLNGAYNTKFAPDENYARELFELFTLGKGPDSKYTEDDVKAAARLLTGWKIQRSTWPINVTFDLNRHDTANKQFSSFFNNTVVTGRNTSTAGSDELEDLLDMVFAQSEVAKFICRKLYRFFVYYEIDANTETNVIEPLADLFRSSNYEIKPVLEKLLLSEHFYDVANRGCYIKTPLDHVIGYVKQTQMILPGTSNGVAAIYDHWIFMWYYSAIIGLQLGQPPNVAGWAAWYQEPLYHEIWINSDSLPKRNQFSDYFLVAGYNRAGFTSKVSVTDFAKLFSDPSDADKLVDEALDFLLPMPPSTDLHDKIIEALLPGGIPKVNWTNAWITFENNPGNTSNTNTVNALLANMFKTIMNLSEYQLC